MNVILNTSCCCSGSDTLLTVLYSNTSVGTDCILFNVMICVESGKWLVIHLRRRTRSDTSLASTQMWLHKAAGIFLLLKLTRFYSCVSWLERTRRHTVLKKTRHTVDTGLNPALDLVMKLASITMHKLKIIIKCS